MANRRQDGRSSHTSIYQSFSDLALLMLAVFIFLFVIMLITSKLEGQIQVPKMKKDMATLKQQLQQSERDRDRLEQELENMAEAGTDAQTERILTHFGLAQGNGRKDFDLFIDGLRDLPGDSLHLVIDATGSMHGVTTFLIPVLQVIVNRSGKRLDALTWFADGHTATYRGTMAKMLDDFLTGAPFTGSDETIGDAFTRAAKNAPIPDAYMLIGDEYSTDRIYYRDIPSPVFTLPIGRADPTTVWQYQTIAEQTGGKMLHIKFEGY